MPLFDGMRDAGDHGFAYALKGYRDSLTDSTVHADAMGFNAQPVLSCERPDLENLPRLQSENGWISALIPSLDRKGLILRIAEYRGRTGAFTLKLPKNIVAVRETDMKEDSMGTLPIANGRVTDVLRPFEIKTLYLELGTA
jgi:alpha-mannosidase